MGRNHRRYIHNYCVVYSILTVTSDCRMHLKIRPLCLQISMTTWTRSTKMKRLKIRWVSEWPLQPATLFMIVQIVMSFEIQQDKLETLQRRYCRINCFWNADYFGCMVQVYWTGVPTAGWVWLQEWYSQPWHQVREDNGPSCVLINALTFPLGLIWSQPPYSDLIR